MLEATRDGLHHQLVAVLIYEQEGHVVVVEALLDKVGHLVHQLVQIQNGGRFIAHLVDKRQLPGSPFLLLKKPGVLDGDGSLIGQELQEVQFFLAELMWFLEGNVHYTHHPLPDAQRQADDSAAPLVVSKQRVAVNIGNDNALPAAGHSVGQAMRTRVGVRLFSTTILPQGGTEGK